ncbi:MAG TPA: class I SAM-dependent methyltransferase [Candidatus Acidoferrum sp.]|nr:class I SAM-dependent methyltransferase [Candidatus Acidoferrum sp.]
MNHKETEDYYRARAGEYEQIYYREVPKRRREIDDEVERVAKLVKGKSVLDLACGTGYWTQVISRTAKRVTAIDVSGEMLAEAKKKSYVAPVEFIEADMFSHTFENKPFDIITVGFWFSHQPKQEYESYFKMLLSLLKKNGLIWLIDNNPPAEGANFESAGTDTHGNNFKRRFLESGAQFVILKNYFSRQDLYDIFRPRFDLKSIVYGTYYWSVVVGRKS